MPRKKGFNLKTKQGWKNFLWDIWFSIKAFGVGFRYAWRDTFFN